MTNGFARKTWIRVGLGFIAILALIGVTITLHAVLASPWVEPVAGVRLELARPILSAADVQPDTAADLLRRAAAALKKDDFPRDAATRMLLVPLTAEELATAKSALQENVEALALARRAAAAPDPQMVTLTSPTDVAADAMAALNAIRLFQLSAAQAAVEKDYARAFDECVSALRLADAISRGGSLIHRLVEISGEMMTFQTVRWLALEHEIPEPVARKMIDALLRLDREMEPWAEVFRYERLVGESAVTLFYNPGGFSSMVSGFPPPGGPIAGPPAILDLLPSLGRLFGSSPASTRRNFDSLYSHLIHLSEQPYDPAAIKAFDQRFGTQGSAHLFLTRDPIGHMLSRISIPVFANGGERHFARLADLRATVLVMAIRQFEHANGHAPATLDELIPHWIARVPLDPFDGKPFRYLNESGWLLYSVGPNQRDEHGLAPKGKRAKADEPGDTIYSGSEAADQRKKLALP